MHSEAWERGAPQSDLPRHFDALRPALMTCFPMPVQPWHLWHGLLMRLPCCAAMGDSELDGTGIETSLNGRLRLTVHKAGPDMPQFLHNLSFPLLENENE